jgi:hypothetical protein
MSLSRIVMRLARNPGTEFAGGDDHRGYALTAPPTATWPARASAGSSTMMARRAMPTTSPCTGSANTASPWVST